MQLSLLIFLCVMDSLEVGCEQSFGGSNTKSLEEKAEEYINKLNEQLSIRSNEVALKMWAHDSNITDYNREQMLAASSDLAEFVKLSWKETIKYPWQEFKSSSLRRQFKDYAELGFAVLPKTKFKRFEEIVTVMTTIYSEMKVRSFTNYLNVCVPLEPDLMTTFARNRNPDRLLFYWKEWHERTGRPVREFYEEYVMLSNEAAVLNNYTSCDEMWNDDFEMRNSLFKTTISDILLQVRPLYMELHAYVRNRLRVVYGDNLISDKGFIPAHLLGNIWAQQWNNLYDISKPFPEKEEIDVTKKMVKQGYTPLKMFKTAEEFYTSLGFKPLPQSFWNNSIIEKPTDRELVCHASAWDFNDGKDFRIKMCTAITMEDLFTIHHEMGHIQYYIEYKDQPYVFREGANSGFHEAIGDVIALSVSTPQHLQTIGLLDENTKIDKQSKINHLFLMALEKVAFLPFAYIMDQYRWEIFRGETNAMVFNNEWWKLRQRFQGICPPIKRTEQDFDAGAKYHTVSGTPYIRYFVSFIIQFQFHKALCVKAEQFDPEDPKLRPLHECDIYKSKAAGKALREMMQMGASKPWMHAMEMMTGQQKMDASALLEYFAPLQEWLKAENDRTGEFRGWMDVRYL